MLDKSCCREKTEGWKGRRRTYKCRECGNKFQVDTLNPLPEKDKLCPTCKPRTHIYTFVNPITGRTVPIRATDAELATVRAWRLNPNLTFQIPQPSRGYQQ